MSYLVIVFGLLIFGMCLYGLVSPTGLISFVRTWESPGGLLAAAGLRLLFAVLLWVAAPATKMPLAFQCLAAVTAFASLVLPLLGQERFASLVEWWAARSAAFLRSWLAVAAAFGVFVVWAALPA